MVTTARLILDPANMEHDLEHFKIHSDPATNLFNPFGPLTNRQESTRIVRDWHRDWEQNGFGYWAVSLQEAPEKIIGFGGITKKVIDGIERLNLYFRFAQAVWGRGLATELGHYAMDEASKLGDHSQVVALVRPDNTPSIKVLCKLGMTPIGQIDDVAGRPPSLLYGV